MTNLPRAKKENQAIRGIVNSRILPQFIIDNRLLRQGLEPTEKNIAAELLH